MSTIAAAKGKTYDMAYIAVFTVLIAICSWISIPTAVPFTLQTFGVFVTVGVLGGRRGTLAVLLYLLLGAVGLPVYSGFTGGIGHLLGTTGGYLAGFLFSALAMWGLEVLFGERAKHTAFRVISMITGLVICYGVGTLWFMVVYARNSGAVGIMTVLGWCVIPFIIPDLVKIALALVLSRRLRRFVV